MRKLDAFFLERFLHEVVNFFADGKLVARLGFVFDPHDHGRVIHFPHTLRFDLFKQFRSQFGVFRDFIVDFFLDNLAYFFHIGVVAHPEVELHDDIVAAEVGHQLEVAERDKIDLAPRVAQPEGTQ